MCNAAAIAPLANDAAVPSEFICPLTLEIMESPMMSRSGKVFERSSILEWLGRGNERCPISRQPLSVSDLLPHRSLKARISLWKLEHGLAEAQEEDQSGMIDDYNTPISPIFVALSNAEFEMHVKTFEPKVKTAVVAPPPMRRRGRFGLW